MGFYAQNDRTKKNVMTVLVVALGLLVLHNQRLTVTDPENTYPKRLKRAIRVLLHPPANKLEEQLIGKGIACEDSDRLYKKVASATVVVNADNAVGAGVFIGPRLIATAEHVVDGKSVRVFLPSVKEEALAEPGDPIGVESIHRVRGVDLAFISTKTSYPSWLELENSFEGESALMVVGHPNRKYYSLQKARIKKKDMLTASDYVLFKDNEIFFGNSGGAIVGCDGRLVGVVSMMSNFQNTRLKQGIGINSRTIANHREAARLG